MNTVRYTISVGSSSYDSTSGALGALRTEASLDAPNWCRIALTSPDSLQIAAGDPVKVELADAGGTLTTVFTGAVEDIAWRMDGVVIDASGAFAALVTARFNLFYERAKAGDIVSDVAARLSLTAGTIDDGLEFPTFALGDSVALYDHLRRLALLSGVDFYADVDDAVVFAAYNPATTHAFRYGSDILSVTLQDKSVRITGVDLFGESPASLGQGSDASSWLAKDEVKGSAGSGSGLTLRLKETSVKDLNAAGAAAQSVLDAVARGKSGIMRTVGYPAACLGHALSIAGMPVTALDGTYKITGITHVVNAMDAFTTDIKWTEV